MEDDYNKRLQEMQQTMKMQAEIKKMMSQILTVEASKRFGNIRAVKPDFALQVELYLLQLFQAGQLKVPVTDEVLKNILDKLVVKRKTKIMRK